MQPHPIIAPLVGTELTARHFAWLTLGASLALSMLGIYAIDIATAVDPPAGTVPLSRLAIKQAIFLLIGLGAASAVAVPHYRFVRFVAWPSMWIVLALLIFLLIPAVPSWIVRPRNGARGWINLGVTDFQPAEVAKIAYVLVLAEYLRFRKKHRTITGLIPPAAITFVPVALITLQPDLGTAMLFIPALFAMLLAAGAKIKHLTIVVIVAAMAGPAAYPLLKPHQKQRIIGMINLVKGSSEGADGINYQSLTAMRLVGAGRWIGVSDTEARAIAHYNRLPERHNDMVFAVIVARFGLIGGLAVLFLYLTWFAGTLLTAAVCRDPFGRLVAIGVAAIIAAQIFINIGMTIGLLPIIGVTLPYISYGGSSMLTVWLMTGLVFNIAQRPNQRLVRPSFEFVDERFKKN